MVYPFPDATQYTAEQEAQMNAASVAPWEIVAQNSTSNWSATFETIKPGVQAQMMGDVSGAQNAQAQQAAQESWFSSAQKSLDKFIRQDVIGGFTTDPNDPNLKSSIISTPMVTDTVKGVAGSAATAVASSVSDAWQKWGNETLVRVGIAVLALLVIYLALRKMV